jgi:hypothetical protein
MAFWGWNGGHLECQSVYLLRQADIAYIYIYIYTVYSIPDKDVAVRSGFEARGGLPRDVVGSLELTYFVTALHRTVSDRDVLSAVLAWASGCHLSVFGGGVAG